MGALNVTVLIYIIDYNIDAVLVNSVNFSISPFESDQFIYLFYFLFYYIFSIFKSSFLLNLNLNFVFSHKSLWDLVKDLVIRWMRYGYINIQRIRN